MDTQIPMQKDSITLDTLTVDIASRRKTSIDQIVPKEPNKQPPRPQPTQPPQQNAKPAQRSPTATVFGQQVAAPPSPAPSRSFLAIPGKYDAEFRFNQPPDTMGAVGTDDMVAFTNRLVYMQQRDGKGETFADLDDFWNLGVSAFDPRVVWDHQSTHFICAAVANAESKGSAVLIGVSKNFRANGDWQVQKLPISGTTIGPYWADYPQLGYSADKIVISVNLFKLSGAPDNLPSFKMGFWIFDRKVFVEKFQLSGVVLSSDQLGSTLFPATTRGSGVTDVFIAQTQVPQTVNVYRLTGPASNPTLYGVAQAVGKVPFADAPSNASKFLPQKGTGDKIDTGDARALSVQYRDGSLYTTHNAFFPAGANPTRCSVMWWQIKADDSTATVIQNGVYDDPTGKKHFAYPSIASNKKGDVLVGFSTFSRDEYPSAAYALHAASDSPGVLRSLYTFKTGNGYYNAANTTPSELRWGDYSNTVADIDDVSFWTIQEYALDEPTKAFFHTWSTWWAQILL